MNRAAGAVLMALMVAVTGCESSPRVSPQPGRPSANASSEATEFIEWPFWPTHMRIHPLTRLVQLAEGPMALLEARLEFYDSEGASTKAIGKVAVQLYADSSVPDSAEALASWNQDLADLVVNRERYDVVTRTYLLKLEIESAKLTPRPDLRAFFVSVNGEELNATLELQ